MVSTCTIKHTRLIDDNNIQMTENSSACYNIMVTTSIKEDPTTSTAAMPTLETIGESGELTIILCTPDSSLQLDKD